MHLKKMKLLIGILALIVLAGCATTTITTSQDGSCVFEHKALFKKTKTMTVEACGGSSTFEGFAKEDKE